MLAKVEKNSKVQRNYTKVPLLPTEKNAVHRREGEATRGGSTKTKMAKQAKGRQGSEKSENGGKVEGVPQREPGAAIAKAKPAHVRR